MTHGHRYQQEMQKPAKKKHRFLRSFLPWKGDRPKEVLRKLGLDVAVIVFCFAAGTLLNQLVIQPYLVDRAQDEVRGLYSHTTSISIPESEPPADSQQSAVSSEPPKDEENRLLKFSDLLAANGDVKGWITVPGTRIDNVVMQSPEGVDPEFYLYRNFDKQYSAYGSIFIDGSSDLGTDSKNIILHGHHMRDGRMFKDLMQYGDLDFYKRTPVFIFDSIYEEAYWKVIAVIKTNTLDEQGPFFNYLRGNFTDDSDFLNFVYQLRVRSLIDTPVDINEDDQLITLSTCSYEMTDFRTAVIARKVRPGESLYVDTAAARLNPNPKMPDGWYTKFGGSPPEVTSFEEALAAGKISWYRPKEDGQGASSAQ
jgi:sortase B